MLRRERQRPDALERRERQEREHPEQDAVEPAARDGGDRGGEHGRCADAGERGDRTVAGSCAQRLAHSRPPLAPVRLLEPLQPLAGGAVGDELRQGAEQLDDAGRERCALRRTPSRGRAGCAHDSERNDDGAEHERDRERQAGLRGEQRGGEHRARSDGRARRAAAR